MLADFGLNPPDIPGEQIGPSPPYRSRSGRRQSELAPERLPPAPARVAIGQHHRFFDGRPVVGNQCLDQHDHPLESIRPLRHKSHRSDQIRAPQADSGISGRRDKLGSERRSDRLRYHRHVPKSEAPAIRESITGATAPGTRFHTNPPARPPPPPGRSGRERLGEPERRALLSREEEAWSPGRI